MLRKILLLKVTISNSPRTLCSLGSMIGFSAEGGDCSCCCAACAGGAAGAGTAWADPEALRQSNNIAAKDTVRVVRRAEDLRLFISIPDGITLIAGLA